MPWKPIIGILIVTAVVLSILGQVYLSRQSQSLGFDPDHSQPRVDGAIVDVQAPSSVDEGQTATVSVTIKNTGNVDATFQTRVGELSKETFLAEGDSQTLTFDLTPTRSHNNISVSLYDNEKRLDHQEAQLSVLYLDGEITSVQAPSSVEENQLAVAWVSIKNKGNKEGIFTVTIDGSNVFSNQTWVPAGGSQTLAINFTAGRGNNSIAFSLCAGDATLDSAQEPIVVSHEITLQMTDNETGKPIDAVDVYVDGTLEGRTVQDGQLDVASISPGRHKVGLDTPGAQGMVEKYINVGDNDQIISVTFDMPNPHFLASSSVLWEGWRKEVMDVKVTLKNMGNVDSQNTAALVLVYRGNDFEKAVDSRLIDFGNIAPGSSAELETGTLNTGNRLLDDHGNRILVVVIDRWAYTPQNGEVVSEIYTPEGLLTQLVDQVGAYLQQHPEVIGKIAGAFISAIL
jgi:hypothetical protein